MGQTPVDGAGDSDDDDWEGGSVISDGSTTASNKGGTTIAPERTRVPRGAASTIRPSKESVTFSRVGFCLRVGFV